MRKWTSPAPFCTFQYPAGNIWIYRGSSFTSLTPRKGGFFWDPHIDSELCFSVIDPMQTDPAMLDHSNRSRPYWLYKRRSEWSRVLSDNAKSIDWSFAILPTRPNSKMGWQAVILRPEGVSTGPRERTEMYIWFMHRPCPSRKRRTCHRHGPVRNCTRSGTILQKEHKETELIVTSSLKRAKNTERAWIHDDFVQPLQFH